MATEDKSPVERKQERESTLVGRDKASDDTTGYISKQIPNVDDPNVARILAMLNAQLNDVEPPEGSPFEWFHRELNIEAVSVETTAPTEATATITVGTINGYTNAEVCVRFSEAGDSLNTTVIETPPTTVSTSDEATITTDALTADTEYNVRAVLVGDHETGEDRAYSETTTIVTPS